MEATGPSPAEVEAYGRRRRQQRVLGTVLGPAVGVGVADMLCLVHHSTHTDLGPAFAGAGFVLIVTWFGTARDLSGADAAVYGGALRARRRRRSGR